MHSFRLALAIPALTMTFPLASASFSVPVDPLRFFDGRTETVGTVRIMFKRPYRTHSLGQGRVEPDGSLTLVQRVEDDGKPAHERRWRVREVGPGRFTASMSEATGPVIIDQVGPRYRFRFRIKGNMSAEQWLTPLPGGRAARTSTKVRRFGMVVATTDGTVRKL